MDGNHPNQSAKPSAVDNVPSPESNETSDVASHHPMEGIKHPGINDVMFGRGGDTNYHIGNHRFRVLADEHREEYRSATRKGKAAVVQAVVLCWRRKSPPGRFLTKTSPEMGDDSLWHDVGQDLALKKAAKILSEKAPSKSKGQKGETKNRKRPPSNTNSSSSALEEQSSKEARTTHSVAAVPQTIAVSAGGAGLALPRAPPPASVVSLSMPPLAHAAWDQFRQLQAIRQLQPNLAVRDIHGVHTLPPPGWSVAGVTPTPATASRAPPDHDFARLALIAHAIAQRESNAAQNRLIMANNVLMTNLMESLLQSRMTAANSVQAQLLALSPSQLESLGLSNAAPGTVNTNNTAPAAFQRDQGNSNNNSEKKTPR